MSNTPPWHREKSTATAFIRENECIGCTKCIPDCPTDAILGAPKLMHTVMTDACTGCGLCVPTCPVDCIEMRPIAETRTEAEYNLLNQGWLKRFEQHQKRDQQTPKNISITAPDSIAERQAYIANALKRMQEKARE